MKSFGIGLAILVGSFASFMLTNALKKAADAITGISAFLQKLAEAGMVPEGITIPKDLGPEVVSAAMGIPKGIVDVAPYICLGIMAFGVLWFWLVEPMLYLLTPAKKEVKEEVAKAVVREAVVPPPAATVVGREPVTYSGRDLKQLVSEAIEQWVTDAIHEKTDRERGK